MKRILISGASRGIGRAIAIECASRDFDEVIVHYHEHKTDAEAVCKKIESLGKKAYMISANFAHPDGIDFLTDSIKQYGELHAFVHAAALNVFKPLSTVRPNQWEMCLQISTGSFIQIANAVYPLMKKGASIVALSSLGSSRAIPNYGPMGPLKAALEGAIRQLAFEFAAAGIRVNAVAPGFVRTSSIQKFPNAEALIALASEHTPLEQRIAEPEEIAPIAAFLLSNDARWITGQILTADGGFSLL